MDWFSPSNLPRNFSGEIGPGEHIAQFYADEAILLDALIRFVDRGLMTGEGVIVIATRAHLRAAEDRLGKFTIGMAMHRLTETYVTFDADEALDKFMVKGWPDEELFLKFVSGLLSRASSGGRRVRAFGEMVALLLAQGNVAATVRLEHLWNRVCKRNRLPLFCAYPSAGFTETSASLGKICAAHSRII
ncbi:MAG: MEDS domain-containing protein [Acidobacteria bacterium]|nr:MEDS domain-containing protein [Acidobacteriota bacterium]